MIFKLHRPTTDLLAGLKGVELGAATHNRFGVDCINVAPRERDGDWNEFQRKMGNEPARIDKYGEASAIPIGDGSVDFVLSSHVVEHVPDVISAFREWDRVLVDGGYVVMIIPLPDTIPADVRPVSTIDQIEDAYARRLTTDTWDYESYPINRGGHYWKFSLAFMKSVIEKHTTWSFIGEESVDSKVGNGFWLALRKAVVI